MCQVQLLFRSFSFVVQRGGERKIVRCRFVDVNLIGSPWERSVRARENDTEGKVRMGERTIQRERYGRAEARFFLAVLAGQITSLIFDNKFPLSIAPSPITAEIYERAWQTGEISTRIFQTQGDSSLFPFSDLSSSLSIQFSFVTSPFSLLMFRQGRQEDKWYLSSHHIMRDRPLCHFTCIENDTLSIVTVYEAPTLVWQTSLLLTNYAYLFPDK